ncbi:ABC transporter ATP-binding protein [Occultella aeris]|uniref:Lipoprotein-releasing system ATP-binding protein LolD n=1 Tax=Occultella aeris TaxID=2761496 RepID=A0A7M4DLQ8_9MICO|nr:ABC transporter ATP-binding protein [Occultella aeris]VZO38234.1 Lipoprotein-releasing system ATP-binding protein LolD [Occultella aeris]
MSLLELRGITRTVRLPDDSRLDILRGVDLSVGAGEHISIVGRSGTGKSTLLNILGLLDAPTDGEYLLDGTPIGRLGNRRRARRRGDDFGFVFQQFNLLPGRTALENVIAPLLYARGRTFWRRQSIAASMLDRMGLGDRLESKPEQLSGGEQQRVAIARALVRTPRVILADEPTGALDVDTGAEIMSMLDEIASDTGAVLIAITHDLAVAARAARHFRLGEGVLTPITIAPRTAGTLAELGDPLTATDVVDPESVPALAAAEAGPA